MNLNAFLSLIDKTTDCWEWRGAKDRDGYGLFSLYGYHRAHRIACVVFKTEKPDGKFVCHHCDNASCVNPDHLYLGTPADNMRDRKLRGSFDGCPRLHRTHCPKGHEFTLANTYVNKKGCNQCKTCRRISYEKHLRNNPGVVEKKIALRKLKTANPMKEGT